MEYHNLDQHETPRDPELVEAFDAFIQHTHVPLDFHAGVRARVQQRARRERFGWRKKPWAEWSPLWVCGATVCALLVLALSLGVGHYVWTQWQPVPTAMPPGSVTSPTVASDTSLPLTTALVSPSPNAHGWYGTDVTITLTAVDHAGGPGVKQMHFALAGASHGTQVVHGTSTTVTISAEGVTTLTYGATDNAENQEVSKTLTVKVDKTPPVITVAAHPTTAGPPEGTSVTITGVITDAGSGVDASITTYAVTDEDGSVLQTGSITVSVTGSYTFTIPLQALHQGDDLNSRQYTVTVQARDNTGNSASQLATFSSTATTVYLIPSGSTHDMAVRSYRGIPTTALLPRPQKFGIDIRSGPGLTYEVLAQVPSGGSYAVVAQEQDWYKIQLPDGHEGWIHRFYTGQEQSPSRTASVVTTPPATSSPVVAAPPATPSSTAPPAASVMPSQAQPPTLTPGRTAEARTVPPMSRRTALVIGNGAYHVGPLRNAVKDATDIAAMLRRLNFEVTLLRNAPLQDMEEAVHAFKLRLREGGIGLFYFAGHGVQADGENYLIPLKARIDRQQDVRSQALPMGRVIGAMEEANNGLNILILDACRNMPFSRSFRSSQEGLAVPPTSPRGMLIAYATAPGGTAADGAGENGVYTKHLLQAMAVPGLSIEQVFKQVRYSVVAETEGKQTPWESSSLLGDFAFVPAQADVAPAGVSLYASASDPETVLWSMSERSSHPEDVLAFLQAYPESRFAPAARLRLQQLQQQSTMASHMPSAPLPGPSTPPRAEELPPSLSTSAPPQQPIERAVPPNVSSDQTPREEAGQTNPMANPSPAPSVEGYTLIRRIYCEDTETGAIQGRTELKFTSPLSCEEAKNTLLVWERQRDHCRFPQSDSNFIDPTARESQRKAKEWIGTPSCKVPS